MKEIQNLKNELMRNNMNDENALICLIEKMLLETSSIRKCSINSINNILLKCKNNIDFLDYFVFTIKLLSPTLPLINDYNNFKRNCENKKKEIIEKCLNFIAYNFNEEIEEY